MTKQGKNSWGRERTSVVVPWRHRLSRSIRSLLSPLFLFFLPPRLVWPILVDKQITLPHIVNMIDSFRFRTPVKGCGTERSSVFAARIGIGNARGRDGTKRNERV